MLRQDRTAWGAAPHGLQHPTHCSTRCGAKPLDMPWAGSPLTVAQKEDEVLGHVLVEVLQPQCIPQRLLCLLPPVLGVLLPLCRVQGAR